MRLPGHELHEQREIERAAENSTHWVDRNLNDRDIDWTGPAANPFYLRDMASNTAISNHFLETSMRWLKLACSLLGIVAGLLATIAILVGTIAIKVWF